MIEKVPFRLKLTGDTAEDHTFQAYDGYMALAGFARTLSLVANYADTGEIRQRGDFTGRDAVQASPIERGSIIADFSVLLANSPGHVFGIASVATAPFLYGLVKRVIDRNLGERGAAPPPVAELLKKKGGDVEALVAISEAPIRQAHSVISNGADKMQIVGGSNILNTFNGATKEYVKESYKDDTEMEMEVSVSAFNANSGYGSVFDPFLGRTVPFSISKKIIKAVRPTFSWGLDQYTNATGQKIWIKFTRILAMDSTPKKYVILEASKLKGV